jgi:hypothetical protein
MIYHEGDYRVELVVGAGYVASVAFRIFLVVDCIRAEVVVTSS